MGIIDFITGQNPNQGAINNAQNAANTATSAQNQLIQSALLPAYNALLQNYNQNYAPMQSGVSTAYQSLLGSNNAGGMSALAQAVASNPQLLQQLTGVNSLGTTQNAVDYLSNPGATLSGLGGVGGLAIGGALSPSVLSQIAPGALSLFENQANGGGPAGNAAPLSLGTFANEAQYGLSPQTLGAALNTQQTQTQQMINSLRNSIGSATPNIGGLASDMQLQGLQGLTGLESSLAGENQNFQHQGAQSLLSGAEGLQGLQTEGMANALNAGTNLDQQQLARLGFAQNIAGGIDQNTLNMLLQGAQLANQTNQGAFGNLFTGANFSQGELGDLANYLQGGMNSLLGGTSGISNIANLYGQAASGAANSAMNLANSGNQQNAQFGSGLMSLAGNLAPYFMG